MKFILAGDAALRTNESGLLIAPGQPEALADALTSLIQDKPLREKLGENARERVQKHFSTEVMVQRHQALYQEVLS